MALKFALDTSVASQPVRSQPHPGVMRLLARHSEALALPAPAWHELVFGCRRLPPSRRRQSIEHYLFSIVHAKLVILPYDADAADWHASERARLVAAGKTPPFVDGQIAAIAAVHGLAVATLDTSGFASFRGVRVEDWGAE